MRREKMNLQRIKYQVEKDMNSFKERESMKEESKKLLSPKGAIVFSKQLVTQPRKPANTTSACEI
jgi:hypothetical protein